MLSVCPTRFEGHSISTPQRSSGTAAIHVSHEDDANRLADLHQQGCARLRLPRLVPGAPLEAVAVNTAGGLTGGDRMAWTVEAGPGAQVGITTQACERLYRAESDVADVSVHLKADPGARLLWWPQETIVFDRAAMRRRLHATVAEDATLLVLEAFLFGRAAMGETMHTANLRDDWRIHRPNGQLIHAEALRITGAADLAGPAALNGMGAMATVLLVAPDVETHLADARAILGRSGAVSCWGGRILARLAATNGYALRRILVPLIERLVGQDVPRGWSL